MPYKDPEIRRARGREAMQRYGERQRAKAAADPAEAARQKAIRQERDRRYYEANRDQILGRARERHWANRDRDLASMKSYYERHREERRAYHREWYRQNRSGQCAKRRALRRERYWEDPDSVRQYLRRWRKANLERARAYVRLSGHRRRAAAGGERITVEEWFGLLAVYQHQCAYCGFKGPLHADHRIPLSRGGRNSIDNIIPACKRCNSRKHTKTEGEFRKYLRSAAKH